MDGLSVFQYDLLATLNRSGDLHGLGIKRQLNQFDRYGEINHGQLYPNLDDLVTLGFVDKGERDGRTNEYTLTSAGKQALQVRIHELEGDLQAKAGALE